MKHIRNFSIIAHIDHGKSTLSDRLIQVCGGLTDREMQKQVLDSMDIERERGITIKAQSVTLNYTANDGETYQLNFIDTPGHVDFTYEVSRSLAACEGALLVVDAGQGVEAQTLANCYTAIEMDLEVIPVLNKIDLPAAEPERVVDEIEDVIGVEAHEAVHASAKSGIGIEEILEQIVERIPAPVGELNASIKALIIDSWFDNYLGVVSLIRVIDGEIKTKTKIKIFSNGDEHLVDEVGIFTPKRTKTASLKAGEVGYLIASIKNIDGAPVGDTITASKNPVNLPIEGFKPVQPRVFAGLFPTSGEDYEKFRDALSKLRLNDAALQYEPENSDALGFGFRIGFLGLLHMEIVQERLEREYDLDLIVTAPSVIYKVNMINGEKLMVDNPATLPDPQKRESIEEPYVRMEIYAPNEYNGTLMGLCQERRGDYIDMKYITTERVTLIYELPLAEVVTDFFDQMKSRTKGYASMEYHLIGYRRNDLVRLDVLINAEKADPLTTIVHRDKAYGVGRGLVEKLKELIPRQQFKIPLQASIGSRIIASESISAMRKDVLAKCYGGDISRKKKLLQKQAKGKKRMKAMGKVDVPQEAFMAVLKLNQAS